jgi:hypothetical protein
LPPILERERDFFGTLQDTRTTANTIDSAQKVRELVQRSSKIQEAAARPFLLLGPRFDAALWPTLLELVEHEDENVVAQRLDEFSKTLAKNAEEGEGDLRERLFKLSGSLGVSPKTAERWLASDR